MSIAVPSQWPPEVVVTFEPVRKLGEGGFATVVLARRKNGSVSHSHTTTTTTTSNNIASDSNIYPDLVAMKIVGSKYATKQEVGYAHREIDILKEVNHPNIMKLYQYWKPPAELHTCAAVMALSYAPGPTLQYLLDVGGKLSLVFARVASAQLVDAIAYLHSRAVIHRDIKPDNVIISGATDNQDEIWDDLLKEDEQDWNSLLVRWRLTLVDFGFARALTPGDMQKKLPSRPTQDEEDAVRKWAETSRHGFSNSRHGPRGGGSADRLDNSNDSFSDSSRHSQRVVDSSRHNNTGSIRDRPLRRSFSKTFKRTMSSVGNRTYAAPEILKNIKHHDISDISLDSQQKVDVTKTLSDHVSYYGIMVDAYSLGCLIKFMMTGVPPNQDVESFIALENHPLLVLCRLLCGGSSCGGGGKSGSDLPHFRKAQFRSTGKIPPEVVRLIRGMTNFDPQQRISVRTARQFPWIDGVLQHAEGYPERRRASRHVHYLSFAAASTTTTTTTSPASDRNEIAVGTTTTTVNDDLHRSLTGDNGGEQIPATKGGEATTRSIDGSSPTQSLSEEGEETATSSSPPPPL